MNRTTGSVALVGAGPGDVELLTLKALRLIQQAEVVVYDRLVGKEILDLIPENAERHDVGKRCGEKSLSQEQINQLLVDLAQQGKQVIRLKGGDPYVFGRGGEEALCLRQHHIPFTVVPGITAAIGCAASCDIPLTHRGVARSVTLITGHLQAGPGKESLPFMGWSQLLGEGHTLVFYMGLEQAAAIRRGLLGHGQLGQTPVALIVAGTTKRQRIVTTTLGELEQAAEALKGETPVLIMVGEVVRLREALHQSCASLLAQVA